MVNPVMPARSQLLQPSEVADNAAEYRAGFLRLVAHLGLDAGAGARFAECVTGRRFGTCGPDELWPVVEQLRALVHEHLRRESPEDGRDPCGS